MNTGVCTFWKTRCVWRIHAFACVLVVGPSTSAETHWNLDERYRAAISDAAVAESDEIVTGLLAVTPGDPRLTWSEDGKRVLVARWAREAKYRRLRSGTRTSTDTDRVIWVTLVPQVRTFCRGLLRESPRISKEMLELRLKQYLGLDPNWGYDRMVEMWVRPGSAR